MFLRIEFWRIARQAVQADVLRHHQRLGDMRTGAVHDHDDEVFWVSGTDLSQEGSHLLGIHNRAEPPVQFSFQRTDRSVNILKLPVRSHWPPPDAVAREPSSAESAPCVQSGPRLETSTEHDAP